MRPLINILVRTHDRPKQYKILIDSIKSQTYSNYKVFIASDLGTNIPYIMENHFDKIQFVYNFQISDYYNEKRELEIKTTTSKYYTFYNLYLNKLMEYINNGYIMFLDDDDCFVDRDSLQTIADSLISDNIMLFWRVQVSEDIVVPTNESFGKEIYEGNVAGGGFTFPAYMRKYSAWDDMSASDYRFIKKLSDKPNLIKLWIDKVLTKAQTENHFGKNML